MALPFSVAVAFTIVPCAFSCGSENPEVRPGDISSAGGLGCLPALTKPRPRTALTEPDLGVWLGVSPDRNHPAPGSPRRNLFFGTIWFKITPLPGESAKWNQLQLPGRCTPDPNECTPFVLSFSEYLPRTTFLVLDRITVICSG